MPMCMLGVTHTISMPRYAMLMHDKLAAIQKNTNFAASASKPIMK
jgi:hypothetical protein